MSSGIEQLSKLPAVEGTPGQYNNIILPCPVTTSSALYLSIFTGLVYLWLIFRFFSTHGIQDIKSITVEIGSALSLSPSIVSSPRRRSADSLPIESSEEFPIRPATPKRIRKPLLRLFIVSALLASLLFLISHLLISFSPSYRSCRGKFGKLFPFLEDERMGSLGWRSNLLQFSVVYYQNSDLQNVVYASSLLLDFSRAFLLSSLMLLFCDFPGAVYRRMPTSVSRAYFSQWRNIFTLFGYLSAPLSIIIMLLLRILISPSSALTSLLATQFFIDFEAIILCGLSFAISFFFVSKKIKQANDVSALKDTFYCNNNSVSNSFACAEQQHSSSANHLTDFFFETTLAIAGSLGCHSVGNFFSYFYYNALEFNSALPPPWVLSLLYWMHYTTIPFINIVVMLVIYPREDANGLSQACVAAVRPLINYQNMSFLTNPTETFTAPKSTSRYLNTSTLDERKFDNTSHYRTSSEYTSSFETVSLVKDPYLSKRPVSHGSSVEKSILSRRSSTQLKVLSVLSRDGGLSQKKNSCPVSYRSITRPSSSLYSLKPTRRLLADSAYYAEFYDSPVPLSHTSLKSSKSPQRISGKPSQRNVLVADSVPKHNNENGQTPNDECNLNLTATDQLVVDTLSFHDSPLPSDSNLKESAPSTALSFVSSIEQFKTEITNENPPRLTTSIFVSKGQNSNSFVDSNNRIPVMRGSVILDDFSERNASTPVSSMISSMTTESSVSFRPKIKSIFSPPSSKDTYQDTSNSVSPGKEETIKIAESYIAFQTQTATTSTNFRNHQGLVPRRSLHNKYNQNDNPPELVSQRQTRVSSLPLSSARSSLKNITYNVIDDDSSESSF